MAQASGRFDEMYMEKITTNGHSVMIQYDEIELYCVHACNEKEEKKKISQHISRFNR